MRATSAIGLAICCLIVAAYFPVYHAHFVSDDKIYLHDVAWLRASQYGAQHIFSGIFESGDYFRPLVIALFAGEGTIFHVAPGPAHLLSLAIHLANTLCVGALAHRLLGDRVDHETKFLPLVAMSLFGLHPLLIEPVAWVSGQFDLVVTLFMLLGLLANLRVAGTAARSACVTTCFFLAACAKESAVAFPLLLLIVDWSRTTTGHRQRQAAIARLCTQWPVYASVFAAGIGYLLLRRWALGEVLQLSTPSVIGGWAQLQLACFTYLTYWFKMLWPMTGLGMLHIVPYSRFLETTLASASIDIGAFALLAVGLWQFRKGQALGSLIVGTTAALLPVLHILPVTFDESFYHDRYATTAIAIACAFLPASISDRVRRNMMRTTAFAASVILLWLVVAVLNIRVTLPLWSDEARLWQWALRDNPDSTLAQGNLLALYLSRDDLANARPLAAALSNGGRECPMCMINVASLAIIEGDAVRATAALHKAKEALGGKSLTSVQVVAFILTTGNLKLLQNDLAGAEKAYRDAVSLGPMVPGARMSLAIVLARKGEMDKARRSAEEGLALFAPDERAAQRQQIARIFTEAENAARASRP
ncbi:MAG TPA: hypothetical protein VGH81_05215 [Rudaea sp.]|jgi:hypothetical protein